MKIVINLDVNKKLFNQSWVYCVNYYPVNTLNTVDPGLILNTFLEE